MNTGATAAPSNSDNPQFSQLVGRSSVPGTMPMGGAGGNWRKLTTGSAGQVVADALKKANGVQNSISNAAQGETANSPGDTGQSKPQNPYSSLPADDKRSPMYNPIDQLGKYLGVQIQGLPDAMDNSADVQKAWQQHGNPIQQIPTSNNAPTTQSGYANPRAMNGTLPPTSSAFIPPFQYDPKVLAQAAELAKLLGQPQGLGGLGGLPTGYG